MLSLWLYWFTSAATVFFFKDFCWNQGRLVCSKLYWMWFCWIIHVYFSYIDVMKFSLRLFIGLCDSYIEHFPVLWNLMHVDVRLAEIKLHSFFICFNQIASIMKFKFIAVLRIRPLNRSEINWNWPYIFTQVNLLTLLSYLFSF